MDFTTPPLLSDFAWHCLTSTRPFQATIYRNLFADRSALDDLLAAGGVVASSGVLDSLCLPDPPPIDFFKSLPTRRVKEWGVYVLVLEKPGHPHHIYVGSATKSEKGVQTRFRDYETRRLLATLVEKALEDGYTITYKALLCTASIPAAALVPNLRLVFLILEAAFTFAFGAHNAKGHWELGCLVSPWESDQFSWTGLCTRSSLWEIGKGDHVLTAEELEFAAEIVKEKGRLTALRYQKRKKAVDPIAYNAKQRAIYAKCQQKKPVQYAQYSIKTTTKLRAMKKFYCKTCDLACTSQFALDSHKKSQRHKRKAGLAPESVQAMQKRLYRESIRASKQHYCHICKKAFVDKKSLDRHLKGRGHAVHVARASTTTSTVSAKTPTQTGTITAFFQPIAASGDGAASS